MNQCAMQQNAFAGCEDMWADRKTLVFCPKPRRVGKLAGPDPSRPNLRWQSSYQADICDSKAGPDFLDIFLIKGGEIASSPPFFCGSPPTRAANPVVHDARFGQDNGQDKPVVLAPTTGMPGNNHPSSPLSPRKTCAPRAKFGFKPAQVRVEGFDCLDRASRRQSVPATA